MVLVEEASAAELLEGGSVPRADITGKTLVIKVLQFRVGISEFKIFAKLGVVAHGDLILHSGGRESQISVSSGPVRAR